MLHAKLFLLSTLIFTLGCSSGSEDPSTTPENKKINNDNGFENKENSNKNKIDSVNSAKTQLPAKSDIKPVIKSDTKLVAKSKNKQENKQENKSEVKLDENYNFLHEYNGPVFKSITSDKKEGIFDEKAVFRALSAPEAKKTLAELIVKELPDIIKKCKIKTKEMWRCKAYKNFQDKHLDPIFTDFKEDNKKYLNSMLEIAFGFIRLLDSSNSAVRIEGLGLLSDILGFINSYKLTYNYEIFTRAVALRVKNGNSAEEKISALKVLGLFGNNNESAVFLWTLENDKNEDVKTKSSILIMTCIYNKKCTNINPLKIKQIFQKEKSYKVKNSIGGIAGLLDMKSESVLWCTDVILKGALHWGCMGALKKSLVKTDFEEFIKISLKFVNSNTGKKASNIGFLIQILTNGVLKAGFPAVKVKSFIIKVINQEETLKKRGIQVITEAVSALAKLCFNKKERMEMRIYLKKQMERFSIAHKNSSNKWLYMRAFENSLSGPLHE